MLLCLIDFFFYLVFQNTNSILCFIWPTVFSFQCIIYFIYLILYFWLVLFYVFFHAIECPYNHYSKVSGKLLVSISSSSSFGEFCCSFIWGLFLYLSHFGFFFVFSTLVVKLIKLSVLSTTRWGTVILVGRAIACPQANVTWRGFLCLRKMTSALWVMTQHRDLGSCSLSSLPRATKPRLSSSVSNPFCSPAARAQG